MNLKRKVILTITRGGNQILYTDMLRVDFTVDKMVGDALNTAKIEIYNLADETISSLYNNKEELAKVKLEVADYDSPLTCLFEGELINLHSTPAFQDKITTLWCWERGARYTTEAPVEPQVFRNVDVFALCRLIASTVKDKDGNSLYPEVNFDAVAELGLDLITETVNVYNFYKPALTSISEILDERGMTFTIRDGIIVVAFKQTKEGQVDTLSSTATEGINKHVINPWDLAAPVSFSIATVEIPYKMAEYINPLDYIVIPDDIQTNINIGEGSLKLAEGLARLAPNTNYQVLKVTHAGSCYTDTWDTMIKGFIYKDSIKG